MDIALYLVLDIAITALVLWLAAKVTGVDLTPVEGAIAATAAAVASLVPTVGVVLSMLVLFYLLKRFTRADIFPDLILMVLVSRIFTMIIALGLVDLGSG